MAKATATLEQRIANQGDIINFQDGTVSTVRKIEQRRPLGKIYIIHLTSPYKDCGVMRNRIVSSRLTWNEGLNVYVEKPAGNIQTTRPTFRNILK